MKFSNIFILIFLIFLPGCEQHKPNNPTKFNLKSEKKYINKGFALIYSHNLDIQKLDNRSLQIFHKSLKKKSLVKITNPINNKSLIAEVLSSKVAISNFYNSIISKRIAETLELSIDEPYIEIILISENSTFVAKKTKTFEEEKNVAHKAPIDGIQISNLQENDTTNETKPVVSKFSYFIKVADFYYNKTADLMIQRIKTETSITDIKLIKLSKTNYRVLIGPYSDIYSLKESFEKMNSLYFENLKVFKND